VTDTKYKRLEFAVGRLQQKWGPRVFLHAPEMRDQRIAISTGFPDLDHLVGIGGVPLNALTLLGGQGTSGKLTLAYKILARAQHAKPHALEPAALFDLSATADADYLTRCGVDLSYLLLVRPPSAKAAVDALLDLVHQRQIRALLVDSIADITRDRAEERYLESNLPQLNALLKGSRCALIGLDDRSISPTQSVTLRAGGALRQSAALDVELQRERWIVQAGELRGYQARARVLKSRWGGVGRSALISIEFDGTVRARATW
jgi:archaellum biogenesis ATPase FlaH